MEATREASVAQTRNLGHVCKTSAPCGAHVSSLRHVEASAHPWDAAVDQSVEPTESCGLAGPGPTSRSGRSWAPRGKPVLVHVVFLDPAGKLAEF
ncbi:uncharacterized protein PGTG_22321 [Puccinia graminis f. sp. tritici CRL 75-36-700-3]|uniref:Uncharacterized protein n=1 Tax=Puccinia graminis f. sp. tritici (strain CRL 75-36-700-3 / race SCCL) TaxID=418459 RepID=H6QU70_PUCGT|nr:uncharacterized protein PGTG_22321 [Puccinia graminis f. sp. tritici CRL 75-36-700-3]EHS64533.1 hypothetical protein PGTG_22321 [Puccinia graminis f. sp. tritici CRL 75-36-700-3]